MNRKDYEVIAECFRILFNDARTNTLTLASAIGLFADHAESTYNGFNRQAFTASIVRDIKAKMEESRGISPSV